MDGYGSDDENDRHPPISLLHDRRAILIAKQQQGIINPREIKELSDITNFLYPQMGGGSL